MSASAAALSAALPDLTDCSCVLRTLPAAAVPGRPMPCEVRGLLVGMASGAWLHARISLSTQHHGIMLLHDTHQ